MEEGEAETAKCSVCGAPSVVHLQQAVNGVHQSIDLCEVCARSYGVFPGNAVPFSVMKTISTALFSQLGFLPETMAKVACSCCGCTLEQIREKGYIGCPQCYEDLQSELLLFLERAQKSLRHIGKRPKNFRVRTDEFSSEKELIEQLKRAIYEEQFEEAAQIRDKIRSLNDKHEGD